MRTAVVTLGTAVLLGAVAPVVVASLGVAQSNVVPGQSDCNTVEACSTPTASAGAISGTVTDGSSNPLQGICVYIYPGGGNLSSNNSKEEAVTTSTGEYAIADVPAGSYAVQFTAHCGSTGNYAPVWFSGASTESASTPVEIAVGKLTANIDAQMPAGGSISGTVTDPTANPVPGVCVSVLLPGNAYQPVATTTTDNVGQYDVQSLGSGSYDVEFDPACNRSTSTAYGILYYNGATTQAAATAVPVTAGSPSPNIDGQLSVSPQASFGSSTISGTVTDPSANGVGNVCVEAFAPGSTPYGPTQEIGYSTTSPTGTYTLGGLGAGQYDLKFDPYCFGGNSGSPAYDIEWWNGTTDGATSQSGAVPVVVTSTTQSITGRNLTLAEATGSVSGTVTSSSLGVAGICVEIADPGGQGGIPSYLFSLAGSTGVTGTYSIADVPVGSWDVDFQANCQGTTYADQWYNGATSPGTATQVSVTSGGTASNIDASLVLAGSISGTVHADCATVSCFISENVYTVGSSESVSGTSETLSGTSMSYTVNNLAPGNYNVQFGVFGNNGAGSEWYNGALSEGSAGTVSVTAASTTSGVDGSFGAISGTVTDTAAPPNDLSGCEVQLFPHGSATQFQGTSTDASGNYSFGVVPAGQFDVDFGYQGFEYCTGTSTAYDGQWWDNTAGGASSQAGASPVTVTASTGTSGIGAALAPYGTSQPPGAISGKVTNALGDPAPLICVDVYPSGSSPAPDYQGETFVDGTYTVAGIPAGSYDVEFDPSCAGQFDPGYPTQYWNGVTSSASATAVTVGTTTVPNVDDTLPLSPTIAPGPAPGATSSTGASSSGSPPTAVASNQGTTVTGAGTGALTVSQYASDPEAAPTFAAADEYFDVALSPGSSFTSVTVDDCNVGGGQSLDWWDPAANAGAGAWETVTGNPGPTFTPGSPSCVSVTLDTTTSPTLSQLTGTVFGVVDGPGPYTPLPPTRICDTRPGNPSGLSGSTAQCNGSSNAGTTLGSQGTLTITVAGQFGVPADATAVVLNVTVVPQDPGYLTVYPAGQTLPTASNLNYTGGDVVPNLVEVGVGADGQASIYSYAPTDVIVDLEGYVAPTSGLGSGGGLYNPLASPARVCDTRSGNPSGLSGTVAQCNGKTMAAGSTLDVQVTGAGGVPSAGVSAVVLNVTVVGPVGPGYLTVWPEDVSPRPTASNLNYQANQVVPNRVVVPVSTTGPNLGQVSIYTTTAADVLVDVSGWYSASGGVTGYQFSAEANPVRICDTRSGNPSNLSGSTAQCNGHTLGPAGSISVQVTGLASVPAGAKAVVLNVTSVLPSSFTYVTVYPQSPVPVVSDLNPYPGEVEPNLVVATLSGTGTIDIYNAAGNNDVVVDVLGWYS